MKGLTIDVRRLFLLGLALWVWAVPGGGLAQACRYNVLEVGFVDLGIEPYHLFGYVGDETPAESLATLQEQVEAALIDTNIVFESMRVGEEPNHPAAGYLPMHKIAAFPAAVLVSPDGQSLPIDLKAAGGSLAEVLIAALERVLVSVKRAEILARCAEAYGVVLVIEGPDKADNDRARDAANVAVGQIAAQMEMMPKAIAKPPEVLTLPADSLADERELLWSLDLKAEDVNVPHAVVFYSRGRWIGPLFRGEQIRPENLADVLFVIGADCECGLDHRWLQGTMLPARWDGALQAKTAASLGLDPESPMIKMEMVSIIRRGMGGFSYPGVPMGYREIEVEEVASEPVAIVEAARAEDVTETAEPVEVDDAREHDSIPVVPEPVAVGFDVNEPVPGEGEVTVVYSPMPVLAWGLGGVALCVVVIGVVVFARAGKQ